MEQITQRIRSAAGARSLAQSQPRNREAQLQYGRAAASAGDLLSAREAFRAAAAAETSPRTEALDGFGRCEHHLGRYEAAAAIYGRLIAAKPESVEGYLGLSRALLPLRRRSESLEILERAVAEVPIPNARDRLALAREFEKRGDLARALSIARPSVAGPGEVADARLTVARLLFKVQNLSQAMPEFERLVAENPRAGEARRYLAAALINPLNPHPDPARSA